MRSLLESRHYTCPEIHQREQERIFRRLWILLTARQKHRNPATPAILWSSALREKSRSQMTRPWWKRFSKARPAMTCLRFTDHTKRLCVRWPAFTGA